MPFVFDTDNVITAHIPQLIATYAPNPDDEIGVIRYIAPGQINAWKCLTVAEAKAIAATNGKIKLALVYETTGKPRGTAQGLADGVYAADMCALYGLPPGGCLIYTSDEDEPGNLPAVADAFGGFFGQCASFKPHRVAYAAGATYDYLVAKGVIDAIGRMVTQSMGFQGSRADIAKDDFDIRQLLSKRIFGLDTDPDVLREGVSLAAMGFFKPFAYTRPAVIAA